MHPTSVLPSNELTLCSAGETTVIYCGKCQQHYVGESVSKNPYPFSAGEGNIFSLFPGIFSGI